MSQKGEIFGLLLQVRFNIVVNNQRIGEYVTDFVYTRNEMQLVENVKPDFTTKNPVGGLKKNPCKSVVELK